MERLEIRLESWKWQTDFPFTWLRWLNEEESIRMTLQLHRGIKEQSNQEEAGERQTTQDISHEEWPILDESGHGQYTHEESGNISATTDDLKSRLDSWKEVTKTVISELEHEFHLYVVEGGVFSELGLVRGSIQSYEDVFNEILDNVQNITTRNDLDMDQALGDWTAFKHIITATLGEINRIGYTSQPSQALKEHIEVGEIGVNLSIQEEIIIA